MGGWEMPDIEAKCTALLLYRMYLPTEWKGDSSMVTDPQLHCQEGKPAACHKVPH